MCPSRWSNSGEYRIGVFPDGDANPILSRDAEIFSGTTVDITSFVLGMEHRNMYLSILRAVDDKKVKKLEERYVKKKAHEASIRLMKDPKIKLTQDDKEYMKMASK
jgi:hypothetical protein